MSGTHRLASTYAHYGCRCRLCKDAHAARVLRERDARTLALAADPTLAPHGSVSTYVNWGCRCEPCRAAHGVELKRQKRDRLAKGMPEGMAHGYAAYNGWGCRCDVCKRAVSEYQGRRQFRAYADRLASK